MDTLISVITPFYHGNAYINTLLVSVEKVYRCLPDGWNIESIIVNDSPDDKVLIDNTYDFPVKIYNNAENAGIQRTRINGLNYSDGAWVIFLDQDDELATDGFLNQLAHTKRADLVIGNSIYEYTDKNIYVYSNEKVMRYFMRKEMFVKIRNLIPSPGECLIRKEKIPEMWLRNPMTINGADDWLLWLMMFDAGARAEVNPEIVYIHHLTESGNLSFDLTKMHDSCIEMCEILEKNDCLSQKERNTLRGAIEYKYIRDNESNKIIVDLKHFRFFVYNVMYKIITKILSM